MQEKTLDAKPVLSKAISVFSDINVRIHSLIECSAKDFDILNHGFREYFSSIQLLTGSTKKALQNIIDIPDRDLNMLRSKLEELTIQANNGTSSFNDYHKSLQKSVRNFSYIFLNLNCVRQNISTLKLLATNIQFDPGTQAVYSTLIKNLVELSDLFIQYENELIAQERKILNCRELGLQIVEQQLPLCMQKTKQLYGVLEDLAQKKEDCDTLKNTLEKLLSEKSVSSSEIITNLQFQDIIRQKIEHVQQAHELLQQNLKQAMGRSESEKKKRNLLDIEILFQIRDIGSLQAAQLVHANNEYQKAVENITSKFNSLDDILSETLELQKQLLPENQTRKERALKKFSKATSALELECDNLQEIVQSAEHACNSLKRKSQEIKEIDIRLEEKVREISALSRTLQTSSDQQSGNTGSVDPIIQLSENLGNFRIIYEKLKETVFDEESLLGKQLQDHSIETVGPFQQTASLLREVIGECYRLLGDFQISGESLAGDGEIQQVKMANSNIEEVIYYKVFEKEVEEIISQLNSLIATIDFEKLDEHYNREELDAIRANYTMASERKVHDQLTGSNQGSDEDNDEIELFN